MDTIIEIDNIKLEKEKAMQRYITFHKIANTLKTLEILLAMTFISISISWTSSYIPTLFQLSVVFLRRLSLILFSPHFIFILGNAIIITLFASSSGNPSESSLEDVFTATEVEVPEEVVNEEVAMAEEKVVEEEEVVAEVEFRRSKSVARVEEEVVEWRELRRSATVPRRKVLAKTAAETEERWRRWRCDDDGLSKEEFNRRVEDFIVKQKKFLIDEIK